MKKNVNQLFNRYAGWFLVIALSLIPVIRWFQINSADLALSSGYSFFSMAGRILGLVGIVLYSINFILSTRLKFLESLFGGLNRVYIAHHIIGGFALVALLLHPLSLALRYVPDQMRAAAEFLLPTLTGSVDWPILFGNFAFFGLVFLLILTFFVKLPYGLWLLTHKYLGLAFFFGGLHAMLIPSDTSNDSFIRWYILGFATLGIISFIYRTLLPRVFVRREKYIVKQVSRPAERIFKINMQPSGKQISYKPGQFVFISFKQRGINPESHPFSISSAPTNENGISITVKALGDYTGDLIELKQGAVAEIEGAFGHFTNTRYKEPKQIWIAGGIGVTPFLSMAKNLAKSRQNQPNEIHMFYVVKNQSELIEHNILTQLANVDGLNFHYNPYLGEVQKRLISADYIRETSGGLKNVDIFICGPPPMMTSLRHQLNDFGVKNSKIHTEEFSIS